jgi:hypothetical protein
MNGGSDGARTRDLRRDRPTTYPFGSIAAPNFGASKTHNNSSGVGTGERPKPRYRYVRTIIDRRGKPRLYFRRPGYPSARLPEPIGGPEFMLAYGAALNGQALPPPSSLPGGIVAKRGTDHQTVQPLIGVYLLMLRGRVVYVGSSLDMPKRVSQHRTNGRPFDQVFYIATVANQRESLERVLIKAIDPPQNKAHRRPKEKAAPDLQAGTALIDSVFSQSPACQPGQLHSRERTNHHGAALHISD